MIQIGGERGRRLKPQLRDWGISTLVAVPFLWLYVAHFLFASGHGTGFLQYDMPYYVSVGRSIFTRGNGVLSPNPFDLNGPAIYFQWFPWLLGIGTVFLHADAGYFYCALGVVFAIGLARVTLALVRACGGRSHELLLLILAFWGGGLLGIGGVLNGLLTLGWDCFRVTKASGQAIMALDSGNGFWFLNWGRNSIFTTEALYHILVGVIWLGVLRNRWLWVAVGMVLITSTHPWTGLEVLGMLLAYLGWVYVARRERPPVWFQLSLALCGCAFFWYYGLYLNQFESHRQIVATWKFSDLVLPDLSFVLSIALVLVVVIYRFQKVISFTRSDEFLGICFLISTILCTHQHWMTPVQPIHFHRGYPWMALFLLGLPAINKWLETRSFAKRSIAQAIGGAAIILLFCSDNLVFIATRTLVLRNMAHSLTLSDPERRLVNWMDSTSSRGLFLASNLNFSYLTSAYSNVTPYLGHRYLTPNFEQHEDTMRRFYSGSSSVLPYHLKYLLITPSDSSFVHSSLAGLCVRYDQDGYRLFQLRANDTSHIEVHSSLGQVKRTLNEASKIFCAMPDSLPLVIMWDCRIRDALMYDQYFKHAVYRSLSRRNG